MIRKILSFSCLVFLIMSSCQTNKASSNEERGTIGIEDDDVEMNAAIAESRSTFASFSAALQSQDSSRSGFCVKVPFDYGDGNEHLWLVDIHDRDGKLFGIVNNEPEYDIKVELGDEVEIDPSTISDWFYIENNRMIGGLTIKVLRNRMTPEEKAELDQEMGVSLD